MKSSLSFCNRTVLLKNVRRFAPLWALYLAGMLLLGPVMLGRQYFDSAPFRRVENAAEYMQALVDAGWFLSFVYALLCAVMCFKYLHKTRSAYMLHALPVDRSTWYCTNVLTGLLFALVPMLLSALLCLVLLLTFGVPNAAGLAFGVLLHWTLQYLCFFGIAVFCMMLTGRTVIGVLTYLAVNGIGAVLPILICETVEPLFYGFTFEADSFLRFSPILQVLNNKHPVVTAPDLWVWLYAAVGVLLLVLGWLHYRKRQVERVGDAMIYGWARVVFQVLFTALCAFCIGWILWMILSGFNETYIYQGYAGFILCLCAGCFVGWFGARMMLRRTVRVFQKRGWLGFGIAAAVLCVFVLSLRFDVLGLQRWVPSQESVSSVEVGASWDKRKLTLSDPARIEQTLQLHRGLLGVKEAWEADADGISNPLTLTYHLNGGLTVRRTYRSLDIDPALRKQVLALYRDADLSALYYRQLLAEVGDKTNCVALLRYDRTGPVLEPLKTSVEELFAAIVNDAAQGRLPINCYYTDVLFEYQLVFSEVTLNESYEIYGYNDEVETFYVTPTSSETLACFGMK